MSGTNQEMIEALAAAQRTQAALERRNYHLHSLFEATQELSSLLQPQKILETFLLLTLGPLGCSRGVVLLSPREGGETLAAWRGLDEEQAAVLRAAPPLPPPGEGQAADGRPRVLLLEPGGPAGAFPPGLEAAVSWSQDGQYRGLLAVGGKLSGEPPDRQDLETLQVLVNVLIASLRHALSAANVRQLNAELARRNEELHQALDQSRRVQGLLEHQVFHLKGMNDLADELSILADTETLLQAFLLHVLELFGVDKGFLLLADRGTRTALPLVRGFSPPGLDFAAWDRLLQACFDAVELRALTPMSVSGMPDPGPVCAAAGLPPGLTTGVFFVIEPGWLGLLALSDKLEGGPLNHEERALLRAQVASLMAFARNIRALEAFRTLNEDLERRNRELAEALASLRPGRRAASFLHRLLGRAPKSGNGA
jgi:hypothetical protein